MMRHGVAWRQNYLEPVNPFLWCPLHTAPLNKKHKI